MKQEGSKVFGDKELFGIEIKPYKRPRKFYLRLWFNSKVFGDFKRGGSLDYLINNYFKILPTFKTLNEEKFNGLNDYQIFDELVSYIEKGYSIEEEDKLFHRMEKYNFGISENQMNNYTILALYLSIEKVFKFLLYEMDGKADPKFYSFDIGENAFFNTYKSFMRYAFENGFKPHGLFFPEGYSLEDIQ